MKKIYLLFVFISLQFSLFGCSSPATQAKEVQEQVKAHRLIIVSSGKPSAVLPAFTTYTWSDRSSIVLSGISAKNEKQLQGYIRDQIQIYLSTKGYEYRENPKQADVIFGFLFALEDDIADQAIQNKFGLLPGLTRDAIDDPRYEKGSLLLAVLDNEDKGIYWRSAVQGFVDLDKDNSEGTSAERVQKILQLMLGDFPEAGK